MQGRWKEDLYRTFSLYYKTAGSVMENSHGRIIADLQLEFGREKNDQPIRFFQLLIKHDYGERK
jgi:hypothetical protein